MKRDILRYISEANKPTFTSIKNAIKIPYSSTLAYHLNSLATFIGQIRGSYHLAYMGKDTFNLLKSEHTIK